MSQLKTNLLSISPIKSLCVIIDFHSLTAVPMQSTGTRFMCQWIMLLHYTNVLLVHSERFPNFVDQLAQFLLLYS